jgi:hypothetical protein
MSRSTPPRPVANTALRGVLVVAVGLLLGFLILRNVNSGGAVDNGGGGIATTTTAAGGTTTTVAAPTTTADLKSFVVVVANASGTSGAAKRKGDAMKAEGFQIADPVTNNTKADTTTIYFLSGYEGAAARVAAYLNISDVQAMPTPAPVDLGQAQVLVNLGKDIAADAPNQVTTTT